mgnify:CR=1 FL=1
MLKKRLVIRRRLKTIPLKIAPAGAAFWINNGPSLRHLLDLSKFLAIITAEQFRYHTERAGNDFAKWVGAVLGDKMCARALEASKTIAATRAAVAKALKRYDV